MTISVGSSVILFFSNTISNKKLGALHEDEVQVEPLKCPVAMVFFPTLLMSVQQLPPNEIFTGPQLAPHSVPGLLFQSHFSLMSVFCLSISMFMLISKIECESDKV